jgi:nucleotide-binding universal stress UspA family protein
MVHLDLEQDSEPALRITCELAGRFKPRVIGVTAGLPAAAIHADGMIASSVLEVDYERLNQAIGHCESRFRSALKDFSDSLEWRSDVANPADFLTAEARAADLLVVGRSENYSMLGPHQLIDIGDAVADVAKWLQHHNIPASARVELSAGDAGSHLDAIACEARIDIIVAGAYGHARLREWIFGGVTRHLLRQSSMCTLLAH